MIWRIYKIQYLTMKDQTRDEDNLWRQAINFIFYDIGIGREVFKRFSLVKSILIDNWVYLTENNIKEYFYIKELFSILTFFK